MSVRSTIENNRAKATNLLQYPDDIGAHGMLLIFSKYAYTRSGTRGILSSAANVSRIEKESSSAIFLPIPSNLEDNAQMRIDRYDQSLMGETFSRSVADITAKNGAGIGLAELAKSYTGSLPINTDKIVNAVMNANLKSLSADAGFLLRNNIGSFSKNIDIAIGNVTNPKSALSFEGVDLKSHSFVWNFMPRSENESESIRLIIQRIKQNVLPKYGEGLGVEKLFLNYPSTLDVFLFGVNGDFYPHYKTSMVRGFNVNYSPSGQLSVVKGGKPSAVQISIDMMEMDIHVAEEYGASPDIRNRSGS